MLVDDKNTEEATNFWESQRKKSQMASTTLPITSQLTKESDTLKQIEIALCDEDAQKIDERCGSNDILIYSYMVAIWTILMHQYTRSQAILLGIPSLVKDISPTMVNVTLPFCQEIKTGVSLREFLQETKKELGNLYKFEVSSCNESIEEVEPVKDQIVISYAPIHHKFTDQAIAMEKDLVINIHRSNKGFTIRALFHQNIQRESVENVIDHYTKLLGNSLAHSIDVNIHTLSMLTKDEYKKVTVDFNSRKIGEFSFGSTLDVEFESIALACAEQVAVKDENVTWSYRELSSESDRIADRLISAGLQQGQVVGLLCERSVYMVAGLLGIIKAGGVFLPLDPELPAERLAYVLDDSGAALVLTSIAQSHNKEFRIHSVLLDEPVDSSGDSISKHQYNHPESLAYIMYTSGSTGDPKGVMIDQNSLLHHIASYSKYVASMEGDHRIGLIAPYYFDMFIEDVFLGLLNGKTLVVLPEAARLDGKLMMQWAVENEISIIQATPSQMRILLSAPEDWRAKANFELFILGGEVLYTSLVKQIWISFPNCKPEIINSYGPTESCIDVTSYRVNPKDIMTYQSVPIGTPMKDVGVYITGAHYEVLPIGVAGELCLSGHVLAKGYIGKLEETAKKFVASPFIPGEILYRTGDLAMWLPNGNIAYLGRMDTQVKVRGQRVELEEIELALMDIEGVQEAVVLHLQDELIGYVVRNEETTLQHIRSSLNRKLPKYMIPSKFAFLSTMPMNANGKVDKSALAQIEQIKVEAGYHAFETNTEKILASLWKDQLGELSIDRKDHFFELGGHSLKAAMLVAAIYTRFKKTITIAQLFVNPQLYQLAALIDQTVEDEQVNELIPAATSRQYPVSSAQKRFVVLNEYASGTTAYNMPGAIEIYGKLDRERFEKTIKTIIERHDVFRTVFYKKDGEVLQVVLGQVEVQIDWLKTATDTISDIQAFIKPFDLSVAPLLRVQVIPNEDEYHFILFDLHHIISDGGSFQLLVQEFAAIYEGNALPAPRLQYKDFAIWEQDFFKSEQFKEHERFWSTYLAGEIPVLTLPMAKVRSNIQSFKGDRVIRHVSKELLTKLNQLSATHGTTMFMNLLAVYHILLAKYTGQCEQIIGTTISTRDRSEWNSVMGPFVNAVAIRQNIDKNLSFTSFLSKLKANVLQVFEHRQYPFDQLLETCRIPKEAGRNPLFDTMLIMHQYDTPSTLSLADIDIKPVSFENPISKMDVSLEAFQTSEGIELCFEYNINLFDRDMMDHLADHFLNLLHDAVQGPSKSIQQLQLMSVSERNWHLYESNMTEVQVSSRTIFELFEAQAKLEPETIAVADELTQVSYQELLNRAETVAHNMMQVGVKKGQLIGIHLERSINFIATVIGVLKSGAAYIPIDTDYPIERVQYILNDSECVAIITDTLQSEITYSGHRLSSRDVLDPSKMPVPLPSLTLDDLAYVIYTSGSTGEPKGAMISHRGLVNYICWAAKVYNQGEKKTYPLYSSISFDLTVTSIFTPLITGGRIEIYAQSSKQALERIVEDGKVDILKLTPSHLLLLKEMSLYNSKVRQLIVGGEKLPVQLVREVEALFGGAEQVEIFNEYGPTETVVGCMIYQVNDRTEGTSVPIGHPADNVKIYILDDHLQPIPNHVIGEIYIGGAGVGLGYLNRPNLTTEKFIPNPFEPEGMMYRTGDLAKRLPDGNIVYLGRMDDQFKIRGYRIELGEVEHYINICDIVSQAVVVAEPQDLGGHQLIAFVVSNAEGDVVGSLKKELMAKVPSYMVPDRIVSVSSIPKTTNGKADRNTLLNQLQVSFVENQDVDDPIVYDALEQELMIIWSELLGIDHINVTDNFFQIGGHSLKAIILLSRLKKKYQLELSLEDLFESPTIKELASLFKDRTKPNLPSIKPVPEQPDYPLTPSQKRLYFLQQMEQGSTYNIIEEFEIIGTLDKQRFTNALKRMVERQEALRTSFHVKDEQGPVQVIHNSNSVSLQLAWIKTEEESVDHFNNDFERPFDISKAPLFRVLVLEEGNERFKVRLNFHHIIFDGISFNHFIEEFSEWYSGESALPALPLQYKDYAVWLNEVLQNNGYEELEQYWLTQLSGELPVLQFPTDYQRPLVKSFEGRQLRFEADQTVSHTFLGLCEKLGITLYMGLASLFAIALYRYTGQEDIIIGTPTSGRMQEELEKLIGMFVNTSVLRVKLQSEDTFGTVVETVKENAIKMLDNQEYPFEQLVEKLNITRDTSRNPIFDVMFVHQNMDQPEINIADEIIIHPTVLEVNKSKFDLTLFAWEERNNTIQFVLEYNTALFKLESIERLSEHIKRLMSAVIESPNDALSGLPMLTEQETEQIHREFNATNRDVEDTTLHNWFELQAKTTPNAVAVVFESTELSYAELNERADRVCQALQAVGVKPHSIVGLLVNRSPEMIIGMLGILKAGAAYLPLDPEFPADRLCYMLNHSRADVLLADPFCVELINDQFSGHILNLYDLELPKIQPIEKENRLNHESSLSAYVIYTSGSTGKPKGVLVQHKSIINTLKWRIGYYGLNDTDAILQLPSFSFDSSVADIFSALLSGAKLVLISAKTRLDVPVLSKLIIEHKITHFLAVPSLYAMLLQTDANCLDRMRSITVAGESLPKKLVEDHFSSLPQVRLFNEYGPTECSVCSTAIEIASADQEVSIGYPIDNMHVYIIDENDNLLPIGIPGDICISGNGLARGYLHDEEETVNKFVPNPFNQGKLMYRTGDKGKWNADGSIMYLGRGDHQVKIRGHRVELEEIERVTLQLQEVGQAAAVVKSTNNGDRVVLYAKSEEAVDRPIQIRMHLARNLPSYMMPNQIVCLPQLPHMPNGKIDRQQLISHIDVLSPPVKSEEDDEQNSPLEAILISAWTEVLATTGISSNDNFFEIGGNSLFLIQLHAKLDAIFPGKLTITDYFAYPTIESLASYLQSGSSEEITYPRIGVPMPDEYQSTAQSRGGTYKAKLEGQMVNRLFKVSNYKEVDLYNLASAALFYVIHQYYKADIVSLYIQLDDNTVQPVSLNIAQMDNFEQLIEAIEKERLEALHEKVESIQTEDLSNDISILFAHTQSLSDAMLAVADLALQVVYVDEEMTVTLSGGLKIASDSLEKLLHGYLRIVSLLSESDLG